MSSAVEYLSLGVENLTDDRAKGKAVKYTTSVQLKMSNRTCGIKVSFWGSGTLRIVIPVKNHPQKRRFRLADYHPLSGGGVN